MTTQRRSAPGRWASGLLVRLIPALAALAMALKSTVSVSAQAARTLTVGQGQVYATLDVALAAARDGDTIEVHGGVYPADLPPDRQAQLPAPTSDTISVN